jgi:hypothetical protein
MLYFAGKSAYSLCSKLFIFIQPLLYSNETLNVFRELDDPHTFLDLLVSTSKPYAFSCSMDSVIVFSIFIVCDEKHT